MIFNKKVNTLKSGPTDEQLRERLKKDCIEYAAIISIICMYFFMTLGAAALDTEDGLLGALVLLLEEADVRMFKLFPCHPLYILFGLLASFLVSLFYYRKYMMEKDVVRNPHGNAAFEKNYDEYNREFVYDPKIFEKVTGMKPQVYVDDDTDNHKTIITQRIPPDVAQACKDNCQLYSQKVGLSINGKWSQRNSNAIVFGASGAGKSRFFLNPNLLQANSSYIITDPSGDIMQGFGAFLRDQGYIVKCLNIANPEMNQSCRFNPLYYIRSTVDIPVIANCLMENTKKTNGGGGGDDFWPKTTQALLCAVFGYLFEVEPVEKRNFYNALELLKAAPQDENADETVDTKFDQMFQLLGKKNPKSFAYNQYKTFKLAPVKTALSILISTAILLSTYIDIPAFNNLTYKDELELEKMGIAPFLDKDGKPMEKVLLDQYGNEMWEYSTNKNGKILTNKKGQKKKKRRKIPYTLEEITADPELSERLQRDKNGYPVEGEPYKMAFFLCIPQGDDTFNWIIAMLYSILFNRLYQVGEKRQAELGLGDPEMAFPVRFLIDECANIGKIPNLSKKMATCRKYRISIVPIFQSYSQITQVYGKEDANSIIGNCDTTLFLGGSDSETLKIVSAHLGKQTVKAPTESVSNSAKSKSTSKNYGVIGKELMSNFEIEQMSNSQCLVLIRAVRPFLDRKFVLQEHKNYKYTAEADGKNYSYINPFHIEVEDQAIEDARIKMIGEEGFNEPKEVKSAALLAQKRNRKRDREKAIDEMDTILTEAFEKCKSDKATMRARREKDNALEECVERMQALDKEAKEDNDKTYHAALVAFDKKFDIGVFFDDEELKEPETCDETITLSEHKDREQICENARNILAAQDGYTPPRKEFDAYTYISSFNPLSEFTSPISDDDKKKFEDYFAENREKLEAEKKAVSEAEEEKLEAEEDDEVIVIPEMSSADPDVLLSVDNDVIGNLLENNEEPEIEETDIEALLDNSMHTDEEYTATSDFFEDEPSEPSVPSITEEEPKTVNEKVELVETDTEAPAPSSDTENETIETIVDDGHETEEVQETISTVNEEITEEDSGDEKKTEEEQEENREEEEAPLPNGPFIPCKDPFDGLPQVVIDIFKEPLPDRLYTDEEVLGIVDLEHDDEQEIVSDDEDTETKLSDIAAAVDKILPETEDDKEDVIAEEEVVKVDNSVETISEETVPDDSEDAKEASNTDDKEEQEEQEEADALDILSGLSTNDDDLDFGLDLSPTDNELDTDEDDIF